MWWFSEERDPTLLTTNHVLDRLKKFDIDQQTLDAWEQALGLSIPVTNGEKQYSPHHINLFKNVKKNLALGRNLEDIKSLISLPPEDEAKPVSQNSVVSEQPTESAIPRPGNIIASKPYSKETPVSLSNPASKPPVSAQTYDSERFTKVLDRVLAEKDTLQKKVLETEKLNSHLYNANNMYHRKVKELNKTIENLQQQLKEDQNLKLLDEKSRLHGQLIQSEKMIQSQHSDIETLQTSLSKEKAHSEEVELILGSKVKDLESQLLSAVQGFDPLNFCGNWQESSTLIHVVYDNFGINVEPVRNRVFQISEPPAYCYGNTAVISTQYEYENNPVWKRYETLMLTHIEQNVMRGQLTVEYIIDGVPVCKVAYQVACNKAVG